MMPLAHIGDTFSEGSHQVLHNVKCFLIIKMVNRFIALNSDQLCLVSTYYEVRVTEDLCLFVFFIIIFGHQICKRFCWGL